MLVLQLYLNGACSEAIELYKKTFGSEVDNIMYDPEAYQIINVESKTITPIGPIFFSPCLVSFIDKFGVRWCFMV
ncbi:hypothetical protein QNH46_09925 [Paenibacillus woosongensis]|uniref:PhnB-like domain-containing protein n=1 Tax=Paenibacillus woosongensis TaxID=307580 RepID=A0AA95IE71_9BACL|nr:hypothetical protein [Paenibacillus woosongensis]WHX50928.1 hypothetical protein QNH46_09925 [Paenibacillus woosongensis]